MMSSSRVGGIWPCAVAPLSSGSVSRRNSATSGGGAIKVTMTGDQKCKGVEIDPDFLKDADAEMLNDLVLTAVNLALDKSRELQEKMMGPLAGGLPF